MDIDTVPPPSTSAALDLLQHVAVRVPCTACGQHYNVSLRQVLLSQAMLHAGCLGRDESDCLPLTYAVLANEAALVQFERSWSRLQQLVGEVGLELTVCHPILSQ